jgi:hypothetical protein
MRPTIYTASKTQHAEKWKALRASGVNVISTWIDEAGPGESSCMIDLWKRCVTEASGADALIVYAEQGDILKGGYVEVGCALANGVPVFVVGPVQGSWVNHPMVTACADLAETVATAESCA